MNTYNRGTGAGGAKTNHNGKKFEDKTDNENMLLENGYTKKYMKNIKNEDGYIKKIRYTKTDYCLVKEYDDKTITYAKQNAFVKCMSKKFNIELYRCPDEAYIIEYKNGRKVLKILEKKNQNVDGSVEIKLWAGPSLKREYEIETNEKFEVVYGFCLNKFLQNKYISDEKKYKTLNQIFMEDNIEVLFGDDENYFETIDKWIYT